MLLQIVQWSAVLCLFAVMIAVFYPAAIVCIVTATAAAYLKMGWPFWWVLLDIVCVALLCIDWSRVVLRAIRDNPGRLWSAVSKNLFGDLEDVVATCQGRLKSHLSKVTAAARHTALNVMRKFMALAWLLTLYPLTLLSQVGLVLLFCPSGSAFCLTSCRKEACVHVLSQKLTGIPPAEHVLFGEEMG